jgi:ribosome-associated protein
MLQIHAQASRLSFSNSSARTLQTMTDPSQSADDTFLVINSNIRIPLSEFSFSFARSAGPGGQNVNKVNSKAILRWQVSQSPNLTPEVRARFLAQNRHRVTAEGEFVMSSQRYRDQPRNIADCHEKLQALLRAAAFRPPRRKKTKPSAGSHRRRMANKRIRSATKQLRGRIKDDG